MANRPVFVPDANGHTFVRTCDVKFEWHAGLAISQKQKCVTQLHAAIEAQLGIASVLEVSSKSREPIGVFLSAFNLTLPMSTSKRRISVECAFQGSKVFEYGGPYRDLFEKSPRDAKADPRLKQSGNLKGFRYDGHEWGLEPQTAFYDWLYLTALNDRADLVQELGQYEAFTDIEFNPKKSINCQAYSVALHQALVSSGEILRSLNSPKDFLQVVRSRLTMNARENDTVQGNLFA